MGIAILQRVVERGNLVKKEYIKKIIKLLNECTDIALLDLILQLLHKSR